MHGEFQILIEAPVPGPHRASSYPIRATNPDGMTRQGVLELDVEDETFQAELAEVREHAPGPEKLRAFGRRLFEAVFTDRIASLWYISRGRDDATGNPLSHRLLVVPPELAELPWELLWDDNLGEHPAMSQRLGVSRGLAGDRQATPPDPSGAVLRVLLVVASPPDLRPIDQAEVLRLRQAFHDLGDRVEPVASPSRGRLAWSLAVISAGLAAVGGGLILVAIGSAFWAAGIPMNFASLIRIGLGLLAVGLLLALPVYAADWFAKLRVVEQTWLTNATETGLRDELARSDYHVLHYLGHGSEGKLCLVSDDGKGRADLDGEALARLVENQKDLRLVVLGACHSAIGRDRIGLFSAVGPTLAAGPVPAVVAMQYPTVQVDTAGLFSDEFYAALARGRAVDAAVNEGRHALGVRFADCRDWSTPVLYLNGESFSLADPRRLGGTLGRRLKPLAAWLRPAFDYRREQPWRARLMTISGAVALAVAVMTPVLWPSPRADEAAFARAFFPDGPPAPYPAAPAEKPQPGPVITPPEPPPPIETLPPLRLEDELPWPPFAGEGGQAAPLVPPSPATADGIPAEFRDMGLFLIPQVTAANEAEVAGLEPGVQPGVLTLRMAYILALIEARRPANMRNIVDDLSPEALRRRADPFNVLSFRRFVEAPAAEQAHDPLRPFLDTLLARFEIEVNLTSLADMEQFHQVAHEYARSAAATGVSGLEVNLVQRALYAARTRLILARSAYPGLVSDLKGRLGLGDRPIVLDHLVLSPFFEAQRAYRRWSADWDRDPESLRQIAERLPALESPAVSRGLSPALGRLETIRSQYETERRDLVSAVILYDEAMKRIVAPPGGVLNGGGSHLAEFFVLVQNRADVGARWRSLASLWCEYHIARLAAEHSGGGSPYADWNAYFRSIEPGRDPAAQRWDAGKIKSPITPSILTPPP